MTTEPTPPGGAIEDDLPCLQCDYNLRGLPGPRARCPECGFVNETDTAAWWWELTAKAGRPPLSRAGVLAAIGWVLALICGVIVGWQALDGNEVSYTAAFLLTIGFGLAVAWTVVFYRTADRQKRIGAVYLLYQVGMVVAILLGLGVLVGSLLGALMLIAWIDLGNPRSERWPRWVTFALLVAWFTAAYVLVRLPGAWLLRRVNGSLDAIARIVPRRRVE